MSVDTLHFTVQVANYKSICTNSRRTFFCFPLSLTFQDANHLLIDFFFFRCELLTHSSGQVNNAHRYTSDDEISSSQTDFN